MQCIASWLDSCRCFQRKSPLRKSCMPSMRTANTDLSGNAYCGSNTKSLSMPSAVHPSQQPPQQQDSTVSSSNPSFMCLLKWLSETASTPNSCSAIALYSVYSLARICSLFHLSFEASPAATAIDERVHWCRKANVRGDKRILSYVPLLSGWPVMAFASCSLACVTRGADTPNSCIVTC